MLGWHCSKTYLPILMTSKGLLHICCHFLPKQYIILNGEQPYLSHDRLWVAAVWCRSGQRSGGLKWMLRHQAHYCNCCTGRNRARNVQQPLMCGWIAADSEAYKRFWWNTDEDFQRANIFMKAIFLLLRSEYYQRKIHFVQVCSASCEPVCQSLSRYKKKTKQILMKLCR